MEEACLHLRKVAESEWRAARLNLPLQLYKRSTAAAAAAVRSGLHCKHPAAWSAKDPGNRDLREQDEDRNISRHLDAQGTTRVLVNHIADGDRRQDLEEVGRNAAVQPREALLSHDLAEQPRHSLLAAVRIAALQGDLGLTLLIGNCFGG